MSDGIASLEDLNQFSDVCRLSANGSAIEFHFADGESYYSNMGSYYPHWDSDKSSSNLNWKTFFNKIGIEKPCEWVNQFYRIESNDLESERDERYDPERGFPEARHALYDPSYEDKFRQMLTELYTKVEAFNAKKKVVSRSVSSPKPTVASVGFNLPKSLAKEGSFSLTIRIS